jgi:hypothetical protein
MSGRRIVLRWWIAAVVAGVALWLLFGDAIRWAVSHG